MEADSRSVRLNELLVHAAWVRGLAGSLLADPHAADDVVQETWLAALRTPPRERLDLRAWLGRVVRNAVRQRGRAGARRAGRERVVASEREEGISRAEMESPEALAERVETQRRLAALVLALDEPFRQTLLLRYYEELSCAEIARRTGVPEGTVRWRSKRGLDELRERLDDDYGSRRAWSFALAPLARRAPTVTTAPSAITGATGLSALLQGVLAMSLALKISLVLAVAAATILLSTFGSMAVGLSPAGDLEPVAVTFLPPAAQDGEPALAEPPPTEPSGARASVDVQEPESVTSGSVVGRVLDPEGRPVPNAIVRFRAYRETEARTDANGVGSVRLPEGWDFSLGHLGVFVVDAAGYLVEEVDFAPSESARVDVGDVLLRPAGAVAGRVLDAQGQPVVDAWVEEAVPERNPELLARWRLERSVRTHGPAEVECTRDELRREMRTDAAGEFLLERVPVGERQLWAGKDGLVAGHTGAVEVRPGLVSAGVVLTLGVRDPQDFAFGRVIDPDDEPVARASIDTEFRSGARSGSSSFQTDERGRFEFAYTPRVARTVRVHDPEGRFAPLTLEGVEGGSTELVLRLERPEWMEVNVSTASGPLEDASVLVWRADRRGLAVEFANLRREDSSVRFTLPSEPFLVVVEAEGYDRSELGPFPGTAAPRSVTCVLEPLPGVRGRVLHAGAGVPGARVALHERVRTFLSVNGFPVRHERDAAADGETDADGSFALTLRSSGDFYLRAEAPGLAPAEVGPLSLAKDVGEELVVELTAGGSIEGRVLPPAGRSPAGTVVVVSRGDAFARTQRVGADGAYRFDRLSPGDWLVGTRDEELSPNSVQSTSTRAPFDEARIETNCRVLEGATTRHDLDLGGAAAPPRLIGTLQLDGRPAQGWTADLIPNDGGLAVRGTRSGRRGAATTQGPRTLDEAGGFELAVERPGPFRLTFQSPEAREGNGVVLSVELELYPGINTFSRSLATGSVVVENPRELHELGIPLDFLLLRVDGVDVLAPVQPGLDGAESLLAGVPAGTGRIARFTLEEFATLSSFPADQPGLVEVVVRAGETTRVRLP